MTKFKKQTSKNKSNIRLHDVLLQYHTKNYKGALKRLRSADIKTGEEQKAKKLEYVLQLKIARSEINEANYTEALRYLLPLTPADARACAFAGIAHLYLCEYTQAAPLLQKATQTYPNFAFYYLLALLYEQKNTSIDFFSIQHQTEWLQCTDNQKKYIKFLINCFADNQDIAIATLKTLNPENDFEGCNLEALNNIVQQIPLSKQLFADNTKPLYRACRATILTENEKQYLTTLQDKVPNLDLVLKKQNNINPTLQKELEEQYYNRQILSDTILTQVMQAASVEQRPYIVYNNAANACNQLYLPIFEKALNHIIVRYSQDFMLVHESLNIVLQLHNQEDVKVYPNTFWQFVQKWLKLRKDHLSLANIEDLAWKILGILLKHGEFLENNYKQAIVSLHNDYPNIVGFKFILIFAPTFHTPPNAVTDSRLDIFTLPNAQKYKDDICSNLEGVFHASSPYGDHLHDESYDLVIALFVVQLIYYVDTFIAAATRYPIHPQNSVILDIFRLFHGHIRDLYGNDDENLLPPNFYQNFLTTYEKVLEQFKTLSNIDEYILDCETSMI
jgi:hypothetical protein